MPRKAQERKLDQPEERLYQRVVSGEIPNFPLDLQALFSRLNEFWKAAEKGHLLFQFCW